MATKRTFLVTGASKGIGRAPSRRLAASGHHVVGVARAKDPGFPGTPESIDLDDSRASGETFADLARHHAFEGVVNHVGWSCCTPVGESELRDVDDMLRVNVPATIQTVQAMPSGAEGQRLAPNCQRHRPSYRLHRAAQRLHGATAAVPPVSDRPQLLACW